MASTFKYNHLMDENMKKLLIILIVIAVIIIIAFFVLGIMSKKGQALGLKGGQLQACASIKNCVISESINGDINTIEPLAFSGDKTLFLNKAKTAVESLNGNIVNTEPEYIAATFTSGIFGFVDDLELRVSDDKQLHFRSASRVGRSDLGANKKRVDALKALITK